jgi:hypothetical protein
MQHAVGENTIEIEFLVTGRVETPEGLEFPSLAGKPCIDTAFNGAEVGADQCVPRGGAQRRAGQFADDFERIAPAGKLGPVAGEQRVDQGEREFIVIAGQVM